MSEIIQALVSPLEYQGSRAHLFPSLESLRWFIRRNKPELIESGAVLEIAGRVRVSPAEFDGVVLAAGKRAMQQREAA